MKLPFNLIVDLTMGGDPHGKADPNLTAALAEVVEEVQEQTKKLAFCTGSRVYGIPKDKSDLDLVVLVSPEDALTICEMADSVEGAENVVRYNGTEFSARFGKLNLIGLTEAKHGPWYRATEILKKQQPVTREKAVEVIKGELKSAGLDPR